MNAQNAIIFSLVLQVVATWRMFSVAVFAGRQWAVFIVAWALVDGGLICRRVFELCTLEAGEAISFRDGLTLFNSAATAVSIEAFRYCLSTWLFARKAKGPLAPEEAALLARLRRT